MAAIDGLIAQYPTLEAMNKVIESEQETEPREYLGMSQIGHSCKRHLFYSFRWAYKRHFDAYTLKCIQDGHHGEDLMVSRLARVPGIEISPVDPKTFKQYEFKSFYGHYSGHSDGIISGLLEAPDTTHVFEHKQVKPEKLRELERAIIQHGEKNALEHWDPIYYAQAVSYMSFSGLTRHYLTCSKPGGREQISVRTNENKAYAKRLLDKAESIIFADEPPTRISDKADWFECVLCDFKDICHGTTIAQPNCRTCVHITPSKEGNAAWYCERHNGNVPLDFQREGCNQHRLIPIFLEKVAKTVDASAEYNYVEYELLDGSGTFVNGSGPDHYSSAEIHDITDARALADEFVKGCKKEMQGTIK